MASEVIRSCPSVQPVCLPVQYRGRERPFLRTSSAAHHPQTCPLQIRRAMCAWKHTGYPSSHSASSAPHMCLLHLGDFRHDSAEASSHHFFPRFGWFDSLVHSAACSGCFFGDRLPEDAQSTSLVLRGTSVARATGRRFIHHESTGTTENGRRQLRARGNVNACS
jgi:hypothetical protein